MYKLLLCTVSTMKLNVTNQQCDAFAMHKKNCSKKLKKHSFLQSSLILTFRPRNEYARMLPVLARSWEPSKALRGVNRRATKCDVNKNL